MGKNVDYQIKENNNSKILREYVDIVKKLKKWIITHSQEIIEDGNTYLVGSISFDEGQGQIFVKCRYSKKNETSSYRDYILHELVIYYDSLEVLNTKKEKFIRGYWEDLEEWTIDKVEMPDYRVGPYQINHIVGEETTFEGGLTTQLAVAKNPYYRSGKRHLMNPWDDRFYLMAKQYIKKPE